MSQSKQGKSITQGRSRHSRASPGPGSTNTCRQTTNSLNSGTEDTFYAVRLFPSSASCASRKLRRESIEQYKAKKIGDGLQNKTIRNHLSILNRCVTTAYEWLELDGVPPKIRWPKAAPTEMDFLSFGECELLLSVAAGIDYEMILMAVRTGLRQGELKGLQWSSIDWENRILAVRYSRDDRTGTSVPPKSNRIRYIPIDADLYEVLFRRKVDTGYVFLDANGRPFDHKSAIVRSRDACERPGCGGLAGIRSDIRLRRTSS